jgi:hypothetical protein
MHSTFETEKPYHLRAHPFDDLFFAYAQCERGANSYKIPAQDNTIQTMIECWCCCSAPMPSGTFLPLLVASSCPKLPLAHPAAAG